MNIRRNSFGNLGIPVRRRELGDTWAVTAGSRRGIQVRDRDGEIMPVQVRKRWSPDRGQRRTTFYKTSMGKALGDFIDDQLTTLKKFYLGPTKPQSLSTGQWLGPGSWVYDLNFTRTGTGGGPYVAIVVNPTKRSTKVSEVTSQAAKSAIMNELAKSGRKLTVDELRSIKAAVTAAPKKTGGSSAPPVVTNSGGGTVAPSSAGFDVQGALQKYGPWVAGAVGLLAVAGGIYLAMSPPKRTTIAVVGP